LEDAGIRDDDGVVGLQSRGLVERRFGAREILAAAEAAGEAEVRVDRRQAGADRRAQLRLGARAVALLDPRVAEAPGRLAVAPVVAHEAFERGDERAARQLARRDLREARRLIAAIFGIRSRPRRGAGSRIARRVAERAEPFTRFR